MFNYQELYNSIDTSWCFKFLIEMFKSQIFPPLIIKSSKKKKNSNLTYCAIAHVYG